MKTFTRDYSGALVDAVQNDINIVLFHSTREIALLPGEKVEQEKYFWSYLTRYNNFRFPDLDPKFSALFDSDPANLARETSRQDKMSLQDHLVSLLDPQELYTITTSPWGSRYHADRFRFFFFSVASHEQVKQFQDNQNVLLEKLLNNLSTAQARAILADSRYYKEDDEFFGLSGDRLVKFIQSNPENFGDHENLRGFYNYVPALGYKLGYDSSAIDSLVRDIGNHPDILVGVGKLANSYGVGEKAIYDFIFKYPEKFCDFESVKILSVIAAKIPDGMEQAWVKTAMDLGKYISKYLWDDHGIDITPGRAVQIVARVYGDKDKIKDELKAKREGASQLRPAPVINPSDIRVANNIAEGVSDIFADETGRPRKDRRETGGKAGLGPQKPDLWKPEQK